MDKALNFSGLLRLQSRDNKHKVKPTQFTSVAGGVKKRLETNVKNKRKTRQTFFDNFRNLPECEPQAEPSLTKGEQRMLQLKKWKEEREKKKLEKLNLKKKPFIVSTVKHVLTYEPLPSMLRPSSSGRVTRSQTSNNVTNNKEVKHKYKFAPKNAAFNPVLKDLVVPPLTVYGREKTAPKKQQPVNNNLLPKPEPRTLRSRTKLNDNTTVKQTSNPGLLSNKTKSNTRKTYVINEPTAKTDIKSKIKKNSSSGEEETLAPKVKKSAKSKKSVPSKDHITDSIGNPPESDKSEQIILPIIVVSPTPIEKLAECSSQPSSMEADVENPQSPKATQSLNTKSTPNRPVNTVEGFTPKNPIPKSESSSEEKLRSPKSNNTGWTPEQIALEVQMISPRVYLSRGKENNRKEMLRKIADGLMDDDYCDMGVHHFKSQLNSEIQNMTEKCATWDKIAEQTTLPDEIQEEVLAAVGQARLLMAQKMQQFASLVRRCELPEPGQALVTTGDLQGFWDMVFMQVENIEIRFKKLEQARAHGWVAEQPEPTAQRQRRPAPPPKQPARAARPPPTSRMKDIIAAARRAKKADTGDVKTFEAGFFSVQSPVKSPATLASPVRAPATLLGRPSLLKSVLSSEAKASAKKSSYAILRASSISKQVDSDESPYEGNQIHMPPINWNATPGKSILKSQTNPTPKSTGKIKFKLFGDNNEQVQNGDDDKTSRVHKLQDAEISADPDKSLNSEELQNIADDTSNAAALATDKLQNLKISSETVEKNTEEKENRRKSRRKLGLTAEETTPVMTRSRRKSLQTPASENLNVTRSSRRKKTLLEVNDVKQPVTPSVSGFRK